MLCKPYHRWVSSEFRSVFDCSPCHWRDGPHMVMMIRMRRWLSLSAKIIKLQCKVFRALLRKRFSFSFCCCKVSLSSSSPLPCGSSGSAAPCEGAELADPGVMTIPPPEASTKPRLSPQYIKTTTRSCQMGSKKAAQSRLEAHRHKALFGPFFEKHSPERKRSQAPSCQSRSCSANGSPFADGDLRQVGLEERTLDMTDLRDKRRHRR